MWLHEQVHLVQTVVSYLSWIITGANVLFLLAALLARVWIDRINDRERTLLKKWNRRFKSRISKSPSSCDETTVSGHARYSRREQRLILKSWWNVFQLAGREDQAKLLRAARHLNVPEMARDQFSRARVEFQVIAARILGYTNDRKSIPELEKQMNSTNPYVALAAFEALIRIDRDRYVRLLMAEAVQRSEFGYHMLKRLFGRLDNLDLSGSLVRSIQKVDLDGREWLIRLLEYARKEDYRPYLHDLLRDRDDPEILANALRLVRSTKERLARERVIDCLSNDAWFVRVQAANALGRVGQPGDWEELTPLLADPEWWVRYRSAQAIVRLLKDQPETMRDLVQWVSDPYAQDILRQVAAESV